MDKGMDNATVAAYLRRIGARWPERPDVAALCELQERHLMSVPFENIDFHLGEPIRLGGPTIDKVVRRRRGGSCRELNGWAFPELLRALGFQVTLLGSRVFTDGRFGTALGHTVIRVNTPEPWLVDVGFGRSSRYPLRLDLRAPQADPHGRFQFIEAPHGDLDLLCDGTPSCRLETRPRTLEDFLPVLWWYQTSPDSPFLHRLFCSLVTPNGRITLSGNVLVRTEYGRRTKEPVAGDAAIRDAYRSLFGITLDRLPTIPGEDTPERALAT